MRKLSQILCVLGMVFAGLLWSAPVAHAQYDTYYSNPSGSFGTDKYKNNDTGYTQNNFSITSGSSSISSSSSSASSSTSSGSGSSSSGGKDLFRTLESKIYDTLMDLREIVYMIAGFGLVMFTVMAIFNKISYKHLGYIMIGLSLLALMFPFIEYFSGYTTQALRNQRELTFRSFLDPNVSMERIQGTGYKEIISQPYTGDVPSSNDEGGLTDEELARLNDAPNMALPEAAKINADVPDIQVPDTIDLKVPTQYDKDKEIYLAVQDAGCNPNTKKGNEYRGTWDETTLTRLVCIVDENGSVMTKFEACEGGKIKNGECKATILTTLNNITQGTQAALNTVANATGAIVSGVGTAIATYEGAKNIVEAVENAQWDGDDFMDTVNNIYGSTQGVLATINRENNIIAGGIMSTTQQIGNTMDGTSTLASLFNTDYENNPTGANNMTNWWNAVDENGNRTNNFYNTLGGISDTTGDIQNAVAIGTGTIGTVAHDTYGIIGTVDNFSQDMGLSQSDAAKLAEQAAAEQQAAMAEAAAQQAAWAAALEAERRAAEEEMRRAQAEIDAQNRRAQQEADRQAAAEQAAWQAQANAQASYEQAELYKQRTQDTKAAFDNLTPEQLSAYVDAGLITEEQALTLAMTSEARKATQAKNNMEDAQQAMKNAQEQYETVSAYAEQANEAVRKAEEKVKNAQGGALMEALWDLQYAKEQAEKVQQAMNEAQSTYNAAQATYTAAEQTYNEQKAKADEAEAKAEKATGGRAWNPTTGGNPYMDVPETGSENGGTSESGASNSEENS